jgi:UDP-N-acetylmuramoyl-tripeptide--D-alanyl-D-alanine ligase
MRLPVTMIAGLPHADLLRFDGLKGKSATGVSTDSRTIMPGNLFFALRGENFDGHRFAEEACRKGALCAVVDEQGASRLKASFPLLVVPDTTAALGLLARQYRDRFDIPVLAVAGSNGKTTTKEMTAAILRAKYAVLSTEGNLNNQIGVPLTLFRLEKRHEVAVIELGTNHPGELERLCGIVRPTMGLLTNIGSEHLEFFGSLDGVEAEEGYLFQSLAGVPGAVAVVNADDERVVRQVPPGLKTFTFAMHREADVRGAVASVTSRGTAVVAFRGGRVKRPVSVELAIPGEHNAHNALAAAAVGLHFRVPSGLIRQALENLPPASRRMEVLDAGGITILNDTYNANPDSMLAALRTLASAAAPGKRIAVLGDMRELGAGGLEEHVRMGREAAALGVDYVLTCGTLARGIHEGARAATFAVHYDQKNVMAEYLAELVSPGDIVLVKASRGMKLEDVVTFLIERLQSAVPMYGR